MDTQAIIAIVEDAQQLEKIRSLRGGFEFFDRHYGADELALAHIVVMDPTGIEPAADWESLADLEARGAAELANTADERDRRAKDQDRDDTCTYTYTSGTTGPPKGVIQTNENMLSMLEQTEATGLMRVEMQTGGLFLFLPLAHSFGRLIELSGPYFDAPIVLHASRRLSFAV